jgi:hypothetical protein
MDPLPGKALRYNDYYLYKLEVPQHTEGRRGNVDGLDDTKIEIAEWIRRVDQNEQRSSFLFPSKMGGPDLMFFLSDGAKRILCAVQVRGLDL